MYIYIYICCVCVRLGVVCICVCVCVCVCKYIYLYMYIYAYGCTRLASEYVCGGILEPLGLRNVFGFRVIGCVRAHGSEAFIKRRLSISLNFRHSCRSYPAARHNLRVCSKLAEGLDSRGACRTCRAITSWHPNRILSEMRSRSRSAHAADQVERKPIAAQSQRQCGRRNATCA